MARRFRGRASLRAVMVVFVVLQVTIPLFVLYQANVTGEPLRFGWSMFSRIPGGAERE